MTQRNTPPKGRRPTLTSATLNKRRARLAALDRELKRLFPRTAIQLSYGTPFELLVAVMLSAQCTDKKVNEVTEQLFKKYRTLDAYCSASVAEFERDIRQTGFFRSKTRHVLATARIIRDVHGGRVPCSMDELVALPGVARKTANIVLGTVCGIVEGIAVDTHVKRFALRFGLSDHADTDKIERDLMAIVPREDWYEITYRIIEYGRKIAPARRYDTAHDPLVAIYPPAAKVFRV